MQISLAADDITVTQILGRSGYQTGLIGEWNLGGEGTTGAPWSKGFDRFDGCAKCGRCGTVLRRFHLVLRAEEPVPIRPDNQREDYLSRVAAPKTPAAPEGANSFPICWKRDRAEFHQKQPARPI